MFGFDGDYRRRPIQNLGGTSTTCDRDTLIRKAQVERQKRNELRQQNNGAVVLQSYARSFIHRQRRKAQEREHFDEYMKVHRDKVLDDEHLSYLLRRLVFFYNIKISKDSDRLIELCQQLVKSPINLLKKSISDPLWLYRLKKLLDLCVTQLTVAELSAAIPLRMLEIYTKPESIEHHIENEQLLNNYLAEIFDYMIKKQYFLRLRKLLDLKCPPLDLAITTPPNPFVEALLSLILRPLLYISNNNTPTITTTAATSAGAGAGAAAAPPISSAKNTKSITFKSFIYEFLSKPMTEAISKFLLPCLAEQENFPFVKLLKALDESLHSLSNAAAAAASASSSTTASSSATSTSTTPTTTLVLNNKMDVDTTDNASGTVVPSPTKHKIATETTASSAIGDKPSTSSANSSASASLASTPNEPMSRPVAALAATSTSSKASPDSLNLFLNTNKTAFGNNGSSSNASHNTTNIKANASNVNSYGINDEDLFTCYLLLSLLVLDKNSLTTMKENSVIGAYLKVMAKISPQILHLPKSTLKVVRHENHDGTSIDDLDSSDEEDGMDEELFKAEPSTLSIHEQQILLEWIDRLNESQRVNVIIEDLEETCDDEVLYAMCQLCHNLMVYNKGAIFEYKLLYTLAFKPKFLRNIWFVLASKSSQMGFQAPIALISKGLVPKQDLNRTISMMATFCMLFGRLLPSLHDMEFCENSLLVTLQPLQTPHIRMMPFSMAEIIQMSKTLKEISMGLVELAFPETRSHLNEHYRGILGKKDTDDSKLRQEKKIWSNLLKVVVFVLNQIYTRDLRLSFCPEGHWIISRLDLPLDRPTDLPLTRENRTRFIRPFQPIRDFTREDFESGPPISTKQIRSITILREIPFVVPFSKRVGILQGLIAADKIRVQGNLQAFLQGPSISITARRTHLYEDAYSKLRPEVEPDLRLKFRILFVSSLGLEEAGIDGGGVFREFLSELLKTAFDPNRGFFMVTTDNKLYPNPNIATLVPDFEKHYYFIGRILGKAIYENLLVELPLAEVFLTKLAGKYADVDIHQLASLDPELYRNLLYLKDYEGEVSELGLDFTVASSSFGQTEIIDLKPNGQSIPVTESNRIEYLQLMANYKLNVQIRKQCTAFRKGLANVLPVEWLYMFSNKEMQILISGAEIPIDIEDLKRNCKYGGEYTPDHPSILAFWEALQSFTDLQRRQFLKFVTSCSRPPLLGFKDLDPPFFIQNAGDMARLPTASTCTNLLKLPPFKTVEQMREKLLYAIQSGAGFELS